MGKTRLEAFSDGVIAILITIMILDMKVPHGGDLASLVPVIPTAASYLLSYLYLGIYWTNHHHMFHTCRKVTGGILWANLHLLFWLSLVPFVTSWMGENNHAPIPVAAYGTVLLLAGIAYWILQQRIISSQGPHSLLAKAVGRDLKGKLSQLIYFVAICLSFVETRAAQALYLAVALAWIVPDRRIESVITAES